ncbi:CPBP family intramembrane metalloprotease [Crossiella sp. CA-258035]|uniref:CPBP family intramembrane glutamic endopeptidase n=1 Tax=Crossiella sp. CA-258035 TaxID=2981138 RepID=UPI0024BC61DD|nr:CPBP family intramembrane glutamic endopeptidase [Crossiella sp. CA-258035]WHT22315.1 CPBP family intramembrane metalloprotease [Crossiella sp. CA-258035]
MGERRYWARLGGFVLVGGLTVIFGCLLLLLLTGHFRVHYTADHDDTLPLWLLIVPALLAIVVTRVVPPKVKWHNPFRIEPDRTRLEAGWLTGIALLYAVIMVLPGGPIWFLSVKPLLLIVVPLSLFWYLRRHGGKRERWLPMTPVRWVAPLAPAVVFLSLTYLVGAYPESRIIPSWPVMVLVFLFNAVIEEFFYRRWLQTRLEAVLGLWPGIVLAAVLWAVWHIGIQSHHGLGLGLLTVLAGHGVRGMFLGYLWARYRNFPVLLLVHGLINAPFLLTSLL